MWFCPFVYWAAADCFNRAPVYCVADLQQVAGSFRLDSSINILCLNGKYQAAEREWEEGGNGARLKLINENVFWQCLSRSLTHIWQGLKGNWAPKHLATQHANLMDKEQQLTDTLRHCSCLHFIKCPSYGLFFLLKIEKHLGLSKINLHVASLPLPLPCPFPLPHPLKVTLTAPNPDRGKPEPKVVLRLPESFSVLA